MSEKKSLVFVSSCLAMMTIRDVSCQMSVSLNLKPRNNTRHLDYYL